MLNIKNKISLAAAICGCFLAYAAAPKQAAAQFIPPGSYQKTCKNIKTNGPNLEADCKAKDENAFRAGTSPLIDYFECDGGSIENDNSVLKCKRNSDSALMRKAKQAIDSGFGAVFAMPGQKSTDSGYRDELREMFKQGYAPQFFAGTLGDGTGAKTATAFYIERLNSPNYAKVKAGLIDVAFKNVYGTGVSPKDLAFYNAQKIGYMDVFSSEQKKMNASQVLYRLAILYAYKKTFGRAPAPTETDYWTPRPQTFSQIVEANRAYLYAPNGAKDLTETVKRHLLDKGNDKPSIQQINAAIVKFSANKAIYEEMK